jgi:HSP20 family protein
MAALPTRRRDNMTARPVRRFQPFPEFDQLQAQVGELLESALAGDAAPWVPAVDIEESDDAWIVEAELPGVDKKDVSIEMNDNELVVRGEVKEREREGILRRRTRRVGEFEFRVTMPSQASADDIDAKLDHGVLRIRVPKAQESQPRRVEISDG